ncbi:MAG TPA: D-alanyl-D-alanine carboxypeptidase/D-alanyl-D-alanine-endopeptidase [Ignavibacteriaceae bacterium]|nr:D-alanyl-D-alanine carboxypeptidase/D-alanyl-D-alanine-endopeptidase [Ignavibacteriaceae bacterium]
MLKYTIFVLIFFVSTVYTASRDEIALKINEILNSLPSSTHAAILVFNPLTQDTVFSLNHTESMIPASNTKLFTTATALAELGGNFVLKTSILTDDADLSDGVINGNLYIKGYGNSLFTTSDLEECVNKLKRKGIRKITGKIIGDDTYFDDVYTRDDWIRDEVANVKLPPISALVLDRNREVVYKKYRRRTRRYLVSVKNPPLNAAQQLKEILIRSGIDVNSSAISGVTPGDATELNSCGIVLRDLLKEINKHSDNFLAECLFKTIGAETSRKQGNAFYSTQAILSFIKDNGIFSEGSSIVDGSGISRFDQITVGALTGVLEKMYFDLAHFDDFYNSLSIAGVDGTLGHRMIGTPADNNFHGKTGTLNGVSSLSGYLTTAKGDDLIISIIFEFDDRGARFYHNIQDDIITLLAGWK